MNSLAGRATAAESRAAALDQDLKAALANTRPSDMEVALRVRSGAAEARVAALQACDLFPQTVISCCAASSRPSLNLSR